MSESKLLSGERYELVRPLGAGGMGTVFLARDHQADAVVVIKTPHKALFRDSKFAARFRREIRSHSRLEHPNIVPISDIGEHKGLPYLVMPWLPGGTLQNRLSAEAGHVDSLHDWLPGIADALDYIHGRGLIHRDVKPANILFDAEGRVFLGDFGIARTVDDTGNSETHAERLTGTGMAMGTPDYMAPELIMSDRIDHRLDQYSLAVCVYLALSGRLPFEGDSPSAVMVKQSTMPAPSLRVHCSNLSDNVISAVDRALRKTPSDRFGSCREFVDLAIDNVAHSTVSESTEKPTSVHCPECESEFKLQRRHAGKFIRCSTCGIQLRVGDDADTISLTEKRSESQTTSVRGSRTVAVRPSSSSVDGPGKRRLLVGGIMALCCCSTGYFAFRFTAEQPKVVASHRATAAPETSHRHQTAAEAPNGASTSSQADGNASLQQAGHVSLALLPVDAVAIEEECELKLPIRTNAALPQGARFQLSENAPTGMLIDEKSGMLTWIPDESQGPNSYNLEVQVHGLGDHSLLCSQEISVNVQEVNQLPEPGTTPPASAAVGQKYTHQLSASDKDLPRNDLTYSLKSGPPGLTVSEAGLLEWDVSPQAEIGSQSLQVSISDGNGGVVTATLTINVGIATAAGAESPEILLGKPHPFFVKHKDFRGEYISKVTVKALSLHVGNYIGDGRFAATLIYHSNATLTQSRQNVSSVVPIGQVFESVLTCALDSDQVQIEVNRMVACRNPDLANKPFTPLRNTEFRIAGDELTAKQLTFAPFNMQALLAQIDTVFADGNVMTFSQVGDKYYEGRFRITARDRNEFEALLIHDRIGDKTTRRVQQTSLAWVTYRVVGYICENGTVVTGITNTVARSPTAIVSNQDGVTDVLVFNGRTYNGQTMQVLP